MARQKPGSAALTPRVTRSQTKGPAPAPESTDQPSRESRRIRGRSTEYGLWVEKRRNKSVVQRPTQAATHQSAPPAQELEDPAAQGRGRQRQNHPAANGSGSPHQPTSHSSAAPAPPVISSSSPHTERTEVWVSEAPLPKTPVDWATIMSMLPPERPTTTPRNRPRTGTPNGTPRAQSEMASSSSKVESSGPSFADILSNSHPFVKSHMKDYDGVQNYGPNDASMAFWKTLRAACPSRLPDPRYDDKIFFKENLERLVHGNEAMLRHMLHDVVCPPAGGLAARIHHDKKLGPDLYQHYDLLADAMDEQWHKRSAIFKTDTVVKLPKPDYCVGFRRWVFSPAQQRKLRKLTRRQQSRWNPTALVYFPFLTCEAKNKGSTVHGNQQNAHSMTLAIMAVVELFTVAKCKEALSREILGFSITYNGNEVNLFCHYPDIRGDVTEIYITRLGTFHYDNDLFEGRWESYDIVRNIYEIWAPYHFKRLCTALDRCDERYDVASLPSNAQGTPSPSEVASMAGDMRVESDTSTVRGAERAGSSTPIPNSGPHQLPPTTDSAIGARLFEDGSVQPLAAAASQPETQRPSGDDETHNNESPQRKKRKRSENKRGGHS